MIRTAPTGQGKRPRWLTAIGTLVASTIGVLTASDLHNNYDVPTWRAIVFGVVLGLIVLATLLQLTNARSSETYRCPMKGCDVQITVRAVTADEAHRLEKLAADHTRHTTPEQGLPPAH